MLGNPKDEINLHPRFVKNGNKSSAFWSCPIDIVKQKGSYSELWLVLSVILWLFGPSLWFTLKGLLCGDYCTYITCCSGVAINIKKSLYLFFYGQWECCYLIIAWKAYSFPRHMVLKKRHKIFFNILTLIFLKNSVLSSVSLNVDECLKVFPFKKLMINANNNDNFWASTVWYFFNDCTLVLQIMIQNRINKL